MEVVCPYCGCEYNISVDALPKPIGDIKLGYGWWLRCCRCHKKWWLKNTVVQMNANSPLTADRASAINRLSKLTKKQQKQHGNRWAIAKYICFVVLALVASYSLYNFEYFKEYINNKIERLSNSMLVKLRMIDVQYKIDGNTLIVTGKITNGDRKVIRLNGVKVSVYNEGGQEVASWIEDVGNGYIISGETIEFSTKHKIGNLSESIRVDVSIL